MTTRPPALALPELRARYDALGTVEELPGERTFRGRCNTFARFLENGATCAAMLRAFADADDAQDALHPKLAALLREAWPERDPARG